MPHSAFRHGDESNSLRRPFLSATDDKFSDASTLRESLEDEVEGGLCRRNIHHSWWNRIPFMTLRTRKGQPNGVKGKEVTTILDLSGSSDVDFPKAKAAYDYCIFGSISGFSILAFLLSFNLLLGIANHLYSDNINDYFSAWGRPGTSSEGLSWYPTDFTRDIIPIRCHSHNDYWRKVPLFSAIRAGCISVEADVWHFKNDDTLYVGHSTSKSTLKKELTPQVSPETGHSFHSM